MAKFRVVDKKVQLSLYEIVKFQIMTYCHFNNIPISDSELSCLSMLHESYDLRDFCNEATLKGYFKCPQSVRNSLNKLERFKLINKGGSFSKRHIYLNPDLKIQSEGNILLNYKILHIGNN